MTASNGLASSIIFAATGLVMSCATAFAHPHVFVEANLEILRNDDGGVTELRHVWRFDEIFSATVLLDFDTNADGNLDSTELDEVSKIVTESIGESGFFTEVRKDGRTVPFVPTEAIMVDFIDNQAIMFFALTFDEPIDVLNKDNFKISVSDPSYYVAMEIADETAIQITGEGTACDVTITRPDFDLLLSSATTLTEEFFANPENSDLGDDWKTWIGLECI